MRLHVGGVRASECDVLCCWVADVSGGANRSKITFYVVIVLFESWQRVMMPAAFTAKYILSAELIVHWRFELYRWVTVVRSTRRAFCLGASVIWDGGTVGVACRRK